jgi:cell division GTPase FtsZ
MSTKTSVETVQQEEIVNDLENKIDNDKMAELKARMAAKKEEEKTMPPRIVEEKRKSIRFGVVGSGQAGSRIAEAFYKLGYPAIAINTAQQDLEHIEIPENNKLFLKYGLGGAAKDLTIGHAAAETYSDEINQLMNRKVGNEESILFCTSLGGGSGAGSSEVILNLILQMQVPIIVITVLPQNSDDVQVKSNALQTLSKFTKMAQNEQIQNLIVVDNAKIEHIYSDVSPFNFFKVSNQAIVNPIHQFNVLSAEVSAVKPLDSNEFGKMFTDGKGLTVYGTMKVENYEDETAIASSLIDNLSGSLLADGFKLSQAKYVGFMLAAPKRVWDKIPNVSLTYAKSVISEACDNPSGIFHGLYEIESEEECITVYSMFSGLGLPTDRIEQLKTETKEKLAAAAKKDAERNLTLKLDVGETNVSAVDAIKQKIAAKKSSFGKLHEKAVIDRRK